MANKHMKRCSTHLIIIETQIKTTMRYNCTPVRMAFIKKSTMLERMWRKRNPLHCLGNVNWNYDEWYGDSLKKKKKKTRNEATIWPSNPTTGHQSVHLLSHVQLFEPHRLQYTRLPCPSPTSGACSNSCPLSWWCHPTISSSVIPFSSCLQPFLASGFFSSESVLCIM